MINAAAFARLVRALLLTAVSALGAVCLVGCADDNGADSGGGAGVVRDPDLVGDWLEYSLEYRGFGDGVDTIIIFDGDYTARSVYSYKSTGDYTYSFFQKTNGVWTVLAYDCSNGLIWRTEGSERILGTKDCVTASPYSVSNGILVLGPYSGGEGVVTGAYNKINLADYRQSLGL